MVLPIETLHHKTDIAPNLETDRNMEETPSFHNIKDQDLTAIGKIHAEIVHLTDTPILDIDHVYVQKTNHFNITLLPIILLQDQETLDPLDLDHIKKQKPKIIMYNQKLPNHHSTLKFICIIPLR